MGYWSGIGEKAFKPKRGINAAISDSLLVSIASRLRDRGEIHDFDLLKERYDRLISNEEYVAATDTGTTTESNVRTRLQLAIEAFVDIP